MSVYRCEKPGCKKPLKLDTEPWTMRRFPGTNRHGIVCEPCAEEIDALAHAGVPDPADEALARDVAAARAVDRAVDRGQAAAARTKSPFRPPT